MGEGAVEAVSQFFPASDARIIARFEAKDPNVHRRRSVKVPAMPSDTEVGAPTHSFGDGLARLATIEKEHCRNGEREQQP